VIRIATVGSLKKINKIIQPRFEVDVKENKNQVLIWPY